jgi:hypothetical protein
MLERLSLFLSEPPTPRRAAAMRISLGLVTLMAYVSSLPHFFAIYGDSGFAVGANLLPFRLHDGVQVTVLILLFVGLFGMIFGVWPRAATALVWFTHFWLWLSNSAYYQSWGLLLGNFLFPSVARPAVPRIGAGFWYRMFQVQVCFVYLLCNLDRFHSVAWMRGETFHMLMADTAYSRYAALDWYGFYPWIAPLTYAAMAVELPAAAFLLFHRTIGPYLLVALIGLHVSLELTSMTQSWQYVMLAALVAFWPESWLVYLEERMRRLGLGRRHQRRAAWAVTAGSPASGQLVEPDGRRDRSHA